MSLSALGSDLKMKTVIQASGQRDEPLSVTALRAQPLVLDATSTPLAAGLLMSQTVRSAQKREAAAVLIALTRFTSRTLINTQQGANLTKHREYTDGRPGDRIAGSAPSRKVLGLIPNVLPAARPAQVAHYVRNLDMEERSSDAIYSFPIPIKILIPKLIASADSENIPVQH